MAFLQAPKNSGSIWYNYKDFYSMVLMACVNANYCFTLIDIGGEGRESDAGIFGRSAMGRLILYGSLDIPVSQKLPNSDLVTPYVFVADDAFPLRQNIMKPCARDNLQYEKLVFNYRLSRARRMVENAFGIMVSRWRILRQRIETSPENAETVLKSIIVLHNYLLSANTTADRYLSPNLVDQENDDGSILPGQWHSDTGNGLQDIPRQGSKNLATTAKNIRDTFKDYFVSKAGKVSWQRGIVNRGLLNVNV